MSEFKRILSSLFQQDSAQEQDADERILGRRLHAQEEFKVIVPELESSAEKLIRLAEDTKEIVGGDIRTKKFYKNCLDNIEGLESDKDGQPLIPITSPGLESTHPANFPYNPQEYSRLTPQASLARPFVEVELIWNDTTSLHSDGSSAGGSWNSISFVAVSPKKNRISAFIYTYPVSQQIDLDHPEKLAGQIHQTIKDHSRHG